MLALMLRVRESAVVLVLAGLALASGHPAEAQRAAMQCALSSVTGVSFGAYDVFSPAPLDAAASLTLRCVGVRPSDQVVIHLGRGNARGYSDRSMSQGRFRLKYQLYRDAARTLVWGDGSSGTVEQVVRPVDGQSLTLPVYGRVHPRQNVAPGAYGDQIAIVVLY